MTHIVTLVLFLYLISGRMSSIITIFDEFWCYLVCVSLKHPPCVIKRQILPDAVQNGSVLKDPQELVVGGDVVEVGAFFVGEEQVGFPDGVQHGRVQIQRGVRILAVRQPRVVPLLPQEDVDPVVLTDTNVCSELHTLVKIKLLYCHWSSYCENPFISKSVWSRTKVLIVEEWSDIQPNWLVFNVMLTFRYRKHTREKISGHEQLLYFFINNKTCNFSFSL